MAEKPILTKVRCFEYVCRPHAKGFPIRSMIVSIYAASEIEANAIFDKHAHKFFEQDMWVSHRTLGLKGYHYQDQTKVKVPHDKSRID